MVFSLLNLKLQFKILILIFFNIQIVVVSKSFSKIIRINNEKIFKSKLKKLT